MKKYMRNAAHKFLFFGTPRFAVIVLDGLKAAGLVPALIVTAPDKPAGRGMRLTPPPVKLWAQENDIKFQQPTGLEIGNWKLEIAPQLFIVAAYGKILPSWLLKIPTHGALNVHPSLLPKYRGSSPIQSQILANERDVGVSIMLLDEKMDHGPIVTSYQLPVTSYSNGWQPSATELEETLAHAGGKLLAETIPKWLAGEITPQEQDHAQATYTKKITREDGLVALEDVAGNPYETFLKIRAFDPWPGTYFFAERQQKKIRVKIKDAVFKNGILEITRVQPEGGRVISYRDFLRGSS
ncbi:MAG: methionyl-tRNA formyltransferase [Patescibacteria group bacterium]|nr:methionyl-tRNA formyltransferase [Patescibacteria group bacterium]